MRYAMRQKIWSFGDDFTIKDDAGRDHFRVDGRAFSIGHKLSFQDMAGHELVYIRQKLLSLRTTYELERPGGESTVMTKKLLTFFRDRFTVDVGADGPSPDDFVVQGNFIDHEYTFHRDGRAIAAVSKKWFSWSDSYGVDIADGEDDVLILACTVVVDLCNETDKDH